MVAGLEFGLFCHDKVAVAEYLHFLYCREGGAGHVHDRQCECQFYAHGAGCTGCSAQVGDFFRYYIGFADKDFVDIDVLAVAHAESAECDVVAAVGFDGEECGFPVAHVIRNLFGIEYTVKAFGCCRAAYAGLDRTRCAATFVPVFEAEFVELSCCQVERRQNHPYVGTAAPYGCISACQTPVAAAACVENRNKVE